MLKYLYHSLDEFSSVFSDSRTRLIFTMVVLGFIGASEMVGVTSLCRFWWLNVNGYHSFLHFFHSQAWCLQTLINQWFLFVLRQNETVFIQGRAIILGDHTYVPKDGRRMPGVVTLHQESETQSKPSYFRGQCWGAIGLLIGSMESAFCLPLHFQIHQGLKQIEKDTTASNSLGERIVQMALDFSFKTNTPSILVLDAYFSVASVFKLATSLWSLDIKAPFVHIIVRAKKSYVAYFPVKQPKIKKSGRPAIYGPKVHLTDFFDEIHLFSTVSCQIYGKTEEVSLFCINLLWKPTATSIRFVFAITHLGPIILMCSDLKQDPVVALELYCQRIRIETMFEVLKQVLGCFAFKFWSKSMPKQSRKPTKNTSATLPNADQKPSVKLCWDAYERFVMLVAMAQGLLQMISLKYTDTVWDNFNVFLRTRSRKIPSERTVKKVMMKLLVLDFFNLPSHATMAKIRKRVFGEKFVKMRGKNEYIEEKQAA